jgi:hypothetical protein
LVTNKRLTFAEEINTYWFGRGKYQILADKLQAVKQTIDRDEYPEYENYLDAVWAYYDINNNAGSNYGTAPIGKIFGTEVLFALHRIHQEQYFNGDEQYDHDMIDEGEKIDWDYVSELIEPTMDKIILETAKALDLCLFRVVE